jgi:hypothetical protein
MLETKTAEWRWLSQCISYNSQIRNMECVLMMSLGSAGRVSI